MEKLQEVMKRFWLEENYWHWSATWTITMTPRSLPGVNLYYVLAVLLLIHFVPSICKVGEKCDTHELNACSRTGTEICVQVNDTSAGVCKCREDLVVDKATGQCEAPKPPPEPSGSHLGLGLGLGLTAFVLVIGAVLFVLHRKFGLLSGLCVCVPSFRQMLGIRSGDIIMVDDQDDDVNPIV